MGRPRTKKPVQIGDEFYNLKVDSEGGRNKSGGRMLTCICICGKSRVVNEGDLQRGATKSCGNKGCRAFIKHGQYESITYQSWRCMRQRCLNTNNTRYLDYGGRGIIIDSDFDNFENFLKEVGECPSPEYSIDRIDNSKGYVKGNLRWATATQQQRNKRTNHLLTYDGLTLCVTEWAEVAGMNPLTLFSRIQKGMSVEDALLTPVKKRRKNDG